MVSRLQKLADRSSWTPRFVAGIVDNARPVTDELGLVEAHLLEKLGPADLEGVGSVQSTM
jgi:hypothetical protein